MSSDDTCQKTVDSLGGQCSTYDKNGNIVPRPCETASDCSDQYTSDYCNSICTQYDKDGNCVNSFSYPSTYQGCCGVDMDWNLKGGKCVASSYANSNH